MPDAIVLVYAGLSLAIGGIAATIVIWEHPGLQDRADGRGKFQLPRMSLGEALVFGLFVAIAWPILAIAAVTSRRGSRR